jgi:ribosome biogenesis protein BMS1
LGFLLNPGGEMAWSPILLIISFTLRAQDRFWAEIYDGAKLFYLSGIQHGKYLKREVLNLARFISVAKFRPLLWRREHSYLLADRVEDITPMEEVPSPSTT